MTLSANIMSLLITPPALDGDPANPPALDDLVNPNRFSYTHISHSVYKDLVNFFEFFRSKFQPGDCS